MDAVSLLETIDLRDIRMIEDCERLRFLLEARDPRLIGGERLGQHLDRDVALERRVGRPIDLAHAAGADRVTDLIRTESCPGCKRHLPPTSDWLLS